MHDVPRVVTGQKLFLLEKIDKGEANKIQSFLGFCFLFKAYHFEKI